MDTTTAPGVGAKNKSSAKIAATPWRYTFLFSVLMVICLMPVMAGLYFESYRRAEDATRARLQAERAVFSQLTQIATDIEPLFFDTQVVVLTSAPPNVWRQRLLQRPQKWNANMAKQLNLPPQQVQDDALVTLLPDGQTLLLSPITHKQSIRTLLQSLIYLIVIVLAVMFIFAMVVSARIMRRLDTIDRTAKGIMAGDMNRRVAVFGDDEFSRLSQTLNAMLEKMQNLMSDLRQVNNNISHDLKRPLNRLRSRIEITLLKPRDNNEYQQTLVRSIEDIDELMKIFNDLLLMGNLDSGSRNYQLQNLSLSELLHSLGDLYCITAEDKQQSLILNIAADVHIFANKNLFAQAIGNLLDNAIKYTQRGGKIHLSLVQHQATATITVSDNGPGIPAEQHQEVFERFSRLDEARHMPGTGLGMALVQSILKVHNAGIRLLDNNPGLRVEIRLRTV